jgi:hypothetical protein
VKVELTVNTLAALLLAQITATLLELVFNFLHPARNSIAHSVNYTRPEPRQGVVTAWLWIVNQLTQFYTLLTLDRTLPAI